MLFGAMLTIVALYIWLASRTRPSMTPEQLAQKYTLDYSRAEQAKMGVDCKNLRPQLRDFLRQRGAPVLAMRAQGQNWDTLSSDDFKRELTKNHDFLSLCERLYEVGEQGRRNELEGLDFTVEVQKNFDAMDILLRYGAPSKSCDAGCMDERFRELQTAYERVLKALG